MAEFRDRLPKTPEVPRSWQSPGSPASRTRRPARGPEASAWAPAPARRRGRWAWVVMVSIVGAVVGVSLAFSSGHHPSTRPRTAGGGQTPQPPLRTQSPALAPTAPPAPAPTGPMPTVDALFAVHVAIGASGYDRIATLASDDCQPNDAIPEPLAGTIQDLGGCVGARFALYVDSAQEA